MPTGRKPDGDQAMTNAERQARFRARFRARHAATLPAASTIRCPIRPIDRRSRPKRWQEAVAVLLKLQAEYADWLAALPESLQDSPSAQVLEDIVNLDLDGLAETELPRGYGRD